MTSPCCFCSQRPMRVPDLEEAGKKEGGQGLR